MDNEKNTEFEEAAGSEETEFSSGSSSRARNRTVMLTPEITGEVRARLAQDLASPVDAPLSAGGSYAAGEPKSTSGRDVDDGFQRPNVAIPAYQPAISNGLVGEGVVWTKESPIVGFLVSYDKNPNGQVFDLRGGRLIVTSEAPGTGNYIVLDDDSVSPMHAIIRISAGGELQVLDQLSEFGTKIQRFGSDDEQELSGDKSTIEHGDVIKFGNRKFHVCIVPVGDES